MGQLTVESLPEDFSEDEKTALIQYVDNGVPGLAKLRDSDIFQWFTMYMAGKTYAEIAAGAKVNKEKVLFIAHKNKWLEKKINHFDNITANLQNKVSAAKLESANTISTIISSFNKYYNEQFTKFLLSGDVSVIEGMDTKLLSQYQKAIESLEKLLGNSGKGDGDKPGPLVNFNINNSDTEVKDNGDGTIDVTAKTNAPDKKMMGDILKLLSKAQQQKEKENK